MGEFARIDMGAKMGINYLSIIVVAILLMTAFSGCVDEGIQSELEQQSIPEIERDATTPHVVVCVIDFGITPYHEVYSRPEMKEHPSKFIKGYPNNSISIPITTGGFNLDNDEVLWNNLSLKTLYWFPGTNVIGAISFSKEFHRNENDVVPVKYIILDADTVEEGGVTHGTGTSSTVVQMNPEVSLVLAQSDTRTLENALSWAVEQPWIDIISMSFGWTVAQPQDFWNNIPMLTKKAVDCGKIVVCAAGNDIAPTVYSQICGPPWVISASGCENETEGKSIVTPIIGFDYVADETQHHAAGWTFSDYMWDSGTSFSAPVTAGVISKILLETRRVLNYTDGIKNGCLIKTENISMTNALIRDTLNKTATTMQLTEWNPANSPYVNNPEMLALTATVPMLPLVSCAQNGWGVVDDRIVNETVSVLLGKKQYEPSLEKQLAEPYMSAIYEIRRQFWENYPFEN